MVGVVRSFRYVGEWWLLCEVLLWYVSSSDCKALLWYMSGPIIIESCGLTDMFFIVQLHVKSAHNGHHKMGFLGSWSTCTGICSIGGPKWVIKSQVFGRLIPAGEDLMVGLCVPL